MVYSFTFLFPLKILLASTDAVASGLSRLYIAFVFENINKNIDSFFFANKLDFSDPNKIGLYWELESKGEDTTDEQHMEKIIWQEYNNMQENQPQLFA